LGKNYTDFRKIEKIEKKIFFIWGKPNIKNVDVSIFEQMVSFFLNSVFNIKSTPFLPFLDENDVKKNYIKLPFFAQIKKKFFFKIFIHVLKNVDV